jgi:hypothetical protein
MSLDSSFAACRAILCVDLKSREIVDCIQNYGGTGPSIQSNMLSYRVLWCRW